MSISLLVLELWHFSFIRDWQKIGKLKIQLSEFCRLLRNWQIWRFGTNVSDKMLSNAASGVAWTNLVHFFSIHANVLKIFAMKRFFKKLCPKSIPHNFSELPDHFISFNKEWMPQWNLKNQKDNQFIIKKCCIFFPLQFRNEWINRGK